MDLLRTSIELDKSLLEEAMKLSKVETKRGVIEAALAEFVERRRKKNLLDIKGSISFADGYDYKAMRKNKGE